VVGADRVFIGQQIGIFGLATIITNAHPKLQSHEYRSMRTLAFVATGSFVVVPLIHGLGIFGLELINKKAFTYTSIAKIGCLLPGTVLYAVSRHLVNIKEDYIVTYRFRKMRFPESRWPGRFDMCSSHSFMHILVVCAAIIQMIGYLKAFDHAHANMSCLSP
jgi:adiponectin receptor